MKTTLDKKILAGFVVCAAILVGVAVISFKNSEEFLAANRWVNHTHEVLYEFEQLLVFSVNAETSVRGFVIAGKEEHLALFEDARAKFSEHLAHVRELTMDNSRQQKNIEELEKLFALRFSHQEELIQLRKTKGFEESRQRVASGEGKQVQDQIRKIIANASLTENELLKERAKASEQEVHSFNVVFAVLLSVIILTLVVVYFIIAINLKALRKAQADAANKNWTVTGSSELVKGMQGNLQVKDLSQVVVNRLATYLNAQVGAIYITSASGVSLALTGTYTLDQEKVNSHDFQFGEGLAGQCAADKRMIVLSDIPSNHFIINTGFGKVLPKNIVAVPFISDDKVVGVIQLGSLSGFTELQKEFLMLITDSIAIAFTSSQAREKTKELLEETQRQAEELEVQQEELRQSNEELQAKTELLERSETELKAQQDELQQINVELEEKANMLEEQKRKLENAKADIETKARQIEITSKYKSEFLANMSHELRTPLNSVLILAQLLSENKNNRLSEKDVEYARNIHTSGADLLNLVNEILDLSKVEAGKMELDIGEVSLQAIVGNAISVFSEIAKNKLVTLKTDIDEQTMQLPIVTDRQRVEQILRNLLSNAFKFTDKGGQVTLSVNRPLANERFRNKSLTTAERVIAFSVTDTGIGIPESKQEIIFEAFQQADGSTKRKYGGTGLGLSISRELALILGGEIHVESVERKGSTFTLFLPQKFDASFISSAKQVEVKVEVKDKEQAKKQGQIQIEQPEAYEQTNVIDDRHTIKEKDRVILIIEDEMPFANVLLDFVRGRKYKGVIATQGNTGLSYARHYKPDAILLDMILPVMDGTEVLKQIKHDPELRHIPVQIISSSDGRKEGLELGAFDFIQKPVTIVDLQKALDKIEGFASKNLKRLLIVEDNQQHNNAIRELIGNGDVKCSSVYLGKEAYEMLCKETFDCVIVDLGLPDMSGFDLLEKIRADDALNKIPIIVYTGKDLKKEDNIRLIKLADTVVLKTADSHARLLDETTLFLHRVESRLPKEKQRLIRDLHKADEVLKNKKILIVDDDIRNIYSLTNALEDEELSCITAENGKAALQALREDPSIDLVLMDVMMPEMDGYEATIEIRKVDEFKKLPIIALTAKAMKGDREKCLAVGMSDYVSKPVNIDQLLSLMRVWLYR